MTDFVGVPVDGAGKRITAKIYNDGANDNHTQVVHIGDRNNPEQDVTVSAAGALRTEYISGAPMFNAFNRMLVSTDDLLSAYKFYEGQKGVTGKIDTDYFTTGGGSVAFDPTNLSYRIRVPSGAGNSAGISSHRRFSYKPGASITMYMVISTNNPAQPNLTARCGLFDENNGLFMEMQDGVIYCVIRDSLSASETRIPQSAWNGDRMDGSGGDFNRSGATMDPTKMQIFAITYQYLSAGAVTFMHYVNGTPVVLHTVGNHSTLTAPYMASTYLPHRFEIETTGGGQVGDTDVYTFCSATVADGYTDLIRTPLGFSETKTLTDGSETAIASFRPQQSYLGSDNRYRYLLQYLNSFSSSEPVELTLYAQCVLSGDTWAQQILGLEIDTAGTLLGGHPYGKNICAGNSTNSINLQLSGGDNSTDGLFRYNNIAESDIWTITARRLSGSGTTDVTVAGAFFEVQ